MANFILSSPDIPDPVVAYWVENFRPSELAALWKECSREKQDEGDIVKMEKIREAFSLLTNVPIESFIFP